MEAIAIDISCAFSFCVYSQLPESIACSDHITEHNYISVFEIFSKINAVIIKANSAMEVEKTECIW